MDLELRDAGVVVAGGASGIGLAIARAFAAEGARVAILDLAAPKADVPGPGFWRCDVTDYAAVQAASDEVRRALGRLDHLVDAAAIGSGKFGYPFTNLEPADWRRVLEVNLLGAVHLAHAFGPRLAAQGAGSIVFIGSVAGQFGSQTDPPYSASKAALINFMQCAAKDLAPRGVRVNLVNPGMVKTALNRGVWEAWSRQQPPEKQRGYEDWAGDKVRGVVPLGRWQEPEDIAAMAVFLASPRAKNITGQCLNVDGGYVMRG